MILAVIRPAADEVFGCSLSHEICMSKKLLALMGISALLVGFVCLPVVAEESDKPKFSTKDVMKKAMKGGLLKKVASGDASDEEKKQLHEMLVALSKNEPKKGEAESWKKLTTRLVKTSKAVVAGEEGAGEKLQKAANCKACHSKHK
jgi:hypothetical protein